MDPGTRTILSNYVASYLSDSLPKERQVVERTG